MVVKCRQQTEESGGEVRVAAACKNITCMGVIFSPRGLGGVWAFCGCLVGGWDSGANDDDDDDGSTKSSYHFMNNAGIC